MTEQLVHVSRHGRMEERRLDASRLYSGSERTGTCVCGHSWGDHHLLRVIDRERVEAIDEEYVPAECLRCVGCESYRASGEEKRDGDGSDS